MTRRTRLLAATATLFLGATPAGAFSCPEIDSDIRRAMTGWQVPGLALGIVENGRRATIRTFGVSDVASRLPVREKTVFGIGSIAKSMAALGFAISDVRNELPLDTPVRSVLSGFPVGVTLRHLLSHRSGWPRHDALWYLNAYDRHALPARLALLPRFAAPGETFQYNNVPFAAAGAFVTGFAGVSWDHWLRRVILEPAGMTSAMTRFSDFRDSPDRATPYFPARDGRITLELRDTDPVGPAAGVYSDIRDMTRYLALLAGGGVIDGKRIVAAKAVRTLMVPTSPRYGLGLRVGTWHGQALGFHPGFIDGYGARISVLPATKSGVIVLTNMSGETPVARIVSQVVLDCLTHAPRTDWVARFGGRRKPPEPAPVPPPPAEPDRAAAAYAGTFFHPAYGRMAFSPDTNAGRLAGVFHGRRFRLDYAGADRWRLTDTHWPLREGLLFHFRDWQDGRFGAVATPLANGPSYRHNAGPILFRRQDLPIPSNAPD